MATEGVERWFAECSKCFAMFRDSAEICGVCPHCGHENVFAAE